MHEEIFHAVKADGFAGRLWDLAQDSEDGALVKLCVLLGYRKVQIKYVCLNIKTIFFNVK